MIKKNVLITGVTGDIGYALAFKYLEKNYNLYLISSSMNKLKMSKIREAAKKGFKK